MMKVKELRIGEMESMNEDQILIQNVINGLLRLKKDYIGPQGCSVKHQQINANKAKLISSSLSLLKEYQQLV